MRHPLANAAGAVNPRWLACEKALGREPGDLKAWEFTTWNDERWHEFAILHGCRNAREVQLKLGFDAYDQWLQARVRKDD